MVAPIDWNVLYCDPCTMSRCIPHLKIVLYTAPTIKSARILNNTRQVIQSDAFLLQLSGLSPWRIYSFRAHIESSRPSPPPIPLVQTCSNAPPKIEICQSNKQYQAGDTKWCIPSTTVRFVPLKNLYIYIYILRRMGKNKALAHHTSTYFHTRLVSI